MRILMPPWWEIRFLGNHLATEILVAVFGLILLVRSDSIGAWLARFLSFFLITDMTVNILQSIHNGAAIIYLSIHSVLPTQSVDGDLLIPTVLLVGLYMRPSLKYLGLFFASLFPYLVWWWGIGFPISMSPPANLSNEFINLVEIGYWSMAIGLYYIIMTSTKILGRHSVALDGKSKHLEG